MDRRGFLRTTFVSGLAVGASGCATPGERTSAPPLAADEIERELAELDRTLARIDSKLARRWFKDRRAHDIEHADESTRLRIIEQGELLRTSMRAATTVSALADLPAANHGDAAVIERLRRVSGEADFAVLGTLERLRNLDAAELAALDRDAEDPRFVEDVAEQVDALSAQLGVGPRRRAHLRSVSKHIGWRLERGEMSALIRETVTKVDESLAAALRQITETGAPAFADGDPSWIERTRAVVRSHQPAAPEPTPVDPAATTEAPMMPPPEPAPAPAEAPLVETERRELESYRAGVAAQQVQLAEQARQQEEAALALHERNRRRSVIFSGVGAGLLVLGGGSLALIAAGGTALIIGVTIGSIALTVGLILLIIGVVLAARVAKGR